MIELSINDITKYYGADKIFEHISFDIKTGERVGLIGPNGCGKTTIFKIIMGREDYQEGNLAFRKGITVGYLDQMPHYESDITALDVMHMAFEDLYALNKEAKKLEKSFENLTGIALEKALSQYGALMEAYESQGGYEIETSISKISNGLKINETLKQMPFQNLSGGEKTRIILAKILLEAPDLLLLDEPSNHLDMEAIEWLEEFLKGYQGTVLIISHDRYFLDRVVTRIVEMEFSKTNEYLGNYSYYVVEKERRFLIEMKYYMNQQKKIKQMERQIERYRIWGVMRDSDKMFRKAKELEKRLEKMDKLDKPKIENKRIKLNANDNKRSGKRVLELENVQKAFEEKVIFEDLNLHVLYQDSVCILGPNGSGKSTLLKMLMNELEADSGIIKWGANLNVGYLPQNVTFEDETKTVVDHLSYHHNISISQARQLLSKVLFIGDDVHKKIESLSGGEKSRLKLCSLLFDEVNCMILDEPTNHLDIESREVLEGLLESFHGTILFVSHDRYFIMKLASKVTEITGLQLDIYDGDYDYYKEEKQKLNELLEEKQPSVAPKLVKKTKHDRDDKEQEKAIKKIGKQIESCEAEIAELEAKIDKIEAAMTENDLSYEALTDLHNEKTDVQTQLDEQLKDWEKLQESLESLERVLS